MNPLPLLRRGALHVGASLVWCATVVAEVAWIAVRGPDRLRLALLELLLDALLFVWCVVIVLAVYAMIHGPGRVVLAVIGWLMIAALLARWVVRRRAERS